MLKELSTVLPDAQHAGLLAADTDIHSALGRMVGAPLSDDDWRLAALGISSRSAREHAPAACVASFSACPDLCSAIWPAFDPLGAASLPPRAPLVLPSPPVPVSMPSLMLLLGSLWPRSRPTLSPSFFRILPSPGLAVSTLMLAVLPVLAPGSRPPRPPATCTSLHHSSGWLCSGLRMPIWDCDAACGLCGEVLDRWCDHALCCGGRGDRVIRHNAVRNTVCSAVSEFTSISPELEKPGLLLPPRSPDPGGTSSGPDLSPDLHSTSGGGRRPADIWVPWCSSGLAEAWDFSTSSLLRTFFLSSASPSMAGVFHEAETRKNSFQNTASQVVALVLEACGGGLSPALREVIAWVSTASRAKRGLAGDTPRDVSLRIAQRISCTLHRENARAVLRRAPETVNGSSGLTGDLVSGTGW